MYSVVACRHLLMFHIQKVSLTTKRAMMQGTIEGLLAAMTGQLER